MNTLSKHLLIYALLPLTALCTLGACNDDVLDRPQLTSPTDDNYWRNENDVRLYCNEYYPQYFTGYNTAYELPWTLLRGYTFNDDLTMIGTQEHFVSTVDPSLASTKLQGADWRTQWNGQMWNFAWVRKSNVLIDRLARVAKPNLTDEAYKHWTAVGRFFRAFEYYRLVVSFGDVPYFGAPINENDLDNMYRDRDPRNMVTDSIYEDLKYALDNVRILDQSALNVNRYIVAAVASNIMLFEGTWQKYHGGDQARAKKYLELCVAAAEVVMNSNKYGFDRDFRSLFGSEDLKGHPEVIMYRHYSAAVSVTHSVAAYSNGTEKQEKSANLQLIKAFICNDGKPYQQSTVADADKFDCATLAKTRDPRFEATFYNFVNTQTPSATLLYADKFTSREGASFWNRKGELPLKYGGMVNVNDAPVIRLAEVVLNWMEAKAVLAEFFGGAAITQADLDKSINAIRNRPLDGAATTAGVKKTASLTLSDLPVDPARDEDVSKLMWEIRRERRMEFVHEHTRLLDIKRWKKIEYMDNEKNPDTLFGPWVDFPSEFPAYLSAANKNVLQVRKADGKMVTYDGTNGAEMVGFFRVINAKARNAFGNEVYLSPVGKNDIQAYKDKGYKLTQTPGWENK